MNFIIALALLAISYAITALTAKKPPTPTATLFSNFKFAVPDEGTPQAVVFGDCWCADWQVLWYGGYTTEAIGGGGGKK